MLQEQIKKGKQIFIVTHNPNIGTLIKGNIITTDIFNTNLNKKFVVNEIIREDNEIDTPQSLYLEGSMKALYERLKVHEEKLIKPKEINNDNNWLCIYKRWKEINSYF